MATHTTKHDRLELFVNREYAFMCKNGHHIIVVELKAEELGLVCSAAVYQESVFHVVDPKALVEFIFKNEMILLGEV